MRHVKILVNDIFMNDNNYTIINISKILKKKTIIIVKVPLVVSHNGDFAAGHQHTVHRAEEFGGEEVETLRIQPASLLRRLGVVDKNVL
jgi:hypothetical protein